MTTHNASINTHNFKSINSKDSFDNKPESPSFSRYIHSSNYYLNDHKNNLKRKRSNINNFNYHPNDINHDKPLNIIQFAEIYL